MPACRRTVHFLIGRRISRRYFQTLTARKSPHHIELGVTLDNADEATSTIDAGLETSRLLVAADRARRHSQSPGISHCRVRDAASRLLKNRQVVEKPDANVGAVSD